MWEPKRMSIKQVADSSNYRKMSSLEAVTLTTWNTVCTLCGAVVTGKELHDRFHRALDGQDLGLEDEE